MVDKQFQEEVEFVNGCNKEGERNKFYCKAIGTDIAVTIKLLCKLADQPEHRSALGLTAGNALNHARFGLIIDLNHLKYVIVPCASCQGKQYAGDREWDKTQCKECTQWEMDGDHPLLAFDIPEGYPVDELTDEEKK